MTPVQSQPIGPYLLSAPGPAGVAQPLAGSAASASVAFSQIRPSTDGIETGSWERRPVPNPIAGPATQASPFGALDPPIAPTSGSTGNSFLDLIAQLMSQLDSVITGLGGVTAPSGTSSPQPPTCGSPLQPDPGNLTSQPGTGGVEIRRLLATGEVS